jgi:hypothetical protein
MSILGRVIYRVIFLEIYVAINYVICTLCNYEVKNTIKLPHKDLFLGFSLFFCQNPNTQDVSRFSHTLFTNSPNWITNSIANSLMSNFTSGIEVHVFLHLLDKMHVCMTFLVLRKIRYACEHQASY